MNLGLDFDNVIYDNSKIYQEICDRSMEKYKIPAVWNFSEWTEITKATFFNSFADENLWCNNENILIDSCDISLLHKYFRNIYIITSRRLENIKRSTESLVIKHFPKIDGIFFTNNKHELYEKLFITCMVDDLPDNLTANYNILISNQYTPYNWEFRTVYKNYVYLKDWIYTFVENNIKRGFDDTKTIITV